MIGKDYSEDCFLFRNAHINLIKNNVIGSNIFDKVPAELSTDWDRHTKPEECLVRIGLTYKTGKNVYKNHWDYRLFKLKVGDIRNIQEISDILHTPIFETPEKVGFPNNPSHTDVLYMDEEVRLKLKAIIIEVTDINRESINEEVLKRKSAQSLL